MQLSALTSMRILLVDDELDRKAVLRVLSKSELTTTVDQATTAAEALTLAAKHSYDAILLDFRLPDQDGLDVLRQLRGEKFESVAVIMLSRLDDPAVAEKCFEVGAQDYLLKDEVSNVRLTRAVKQARQRYTIDQELRRSRERLRELSEHDPLTGLHNRRGFELALEHALENARRAQANMAMLLLDLDDFKSVNDTLGHDIGDLMLVRITRRLKSVMRDTDFLCRLGGDEFVVVMQGLANEQDAVCLVNRIFHVLRLPIQIGEEKLQVTASIGIAVVSDLLGPGTDLLRCADLAMYQAKKNGRNQSCFYNKGLQESVEQSVRIKAELKTAIANNEFRVFYQPKIASADGRLVAMEALMRWQHPVRGLLAPDQFLAIAEESGLIVDIGKLILHEACRQLKVWHNTYPRRFDELAVSVNLSAAQIKRESLCETVTLALAQHALDARFLELEITESALIENVASRIEILDAIVATGASFSLDDFGTGYSSFSHLSLFPIAVIKIDRGFVDAVGKGGKKENLLSAMIVFAKTLGLKIVAEGIETEAQARFCRQHGCDLLQGYYFSRPIAADDFEARFLSNSPN